MAKQHIEIKRFSGLSESDKEGVRSSFLWAEKVDFRTDPTKLTLLPRTAKESGSVVVDLPMAADRQGTDTYLYGNTGHLYKRNSSFTWSDLVTVPNSSGNGLRYYGEDGYLYYPSDKVIGRYGPLTSTPTFTNDFLGSEGGVPTNTHSLILNGTTQYATAADSASLSQTGDISLEIFTRPSSLPAVGASKTLIAKWNGSSDERSFDFNLYGVSGYFGDGSDGALTISSDTTEAPIDSACTGTTGTYSLTATNASFATGQVIFIIQYQGTGAGLWQRNKIVGYTAGTITLETALNRTYTSGSQVRVLKQYTNVTINSGKTYTCKAWNGTVGGILAFLANGTVTVTGTITGSAKGYVGGAGRSGAGAPWCGYQGEGYGGVGGISTSPNGNGGGAAQFNSGGGETSAGGASNGTQGYPSYSFGVLIGQSSTAGTADLTTMTPAGAGGGSGSHDDAGGHRNYGGNGGANIFIIAADMSVTGAITSNGGNGVSDSHVDTYCSSGGAGGNILIKTQTSVLGAGLITANGGVGGTGYNAARSGGYGGSGRIHIDYYTSYTGTTSPTIDAAQDDSLVTTTSYQLRLGISSTGANEEYLTKTISAGLLTSQWYRFGVSFDASASLAEFYVDASSIGTSTGTLTAIYDGTALYSIGARFDAAGAAENFLPAMVDDVRMWSDIRTTSEMVANNLVEVSGLSGNLVAYHQLDNAATDETANANNLTLVGSPSYTTTVPFSAPTTRRDLDQSLDTSGNTYALPQAISETVTNRQSFVPAKDPQKSFEVNISDTGDDSDWTVTIHDALNRTVATSTITHANLHTGDNEFVYTSIFRPVIGATYHAHITATTATGTPLIVSTSANDLETADFHTYYQFLVEDDYHPCELIAGKLAIGNERYIATWDGATYNPHAITLPSGFRVRCLGLYRGLLAIGISLGTNIFDYDYGYLFFWDGTSTTYNDFEPVPQGAVNSIISGSPLRFVAGYSGDYCEYNGGEVEVVKRMPYMTDKKYIEVAPKATTMWRSIVHLGMGLNTDSSDFYQGVYAYGKVSSLIEKALSYDYELSLGIKQSTGLRIGLLFPVGKSLLIGWQNGTSYGVDVVSPDNAPFATGRYESLITDIGKLRQEKIAYYLRSYFKALASGDSIQNEYKLDRSSGWTSLGTQSTADKKELRTQLPNKGNRFNEFQFSTVISTSNSTSPEYYGTAIEIDDLDGENRT